MRLLICIGLTLVCTVAAKNATDIIKLPDEARLVQALLARYQQLGTAARPRQDSSQNVSLRFGMRLITLDVDEKAQTLVASLWLRHLWYDDFLTWDPADYGNLTGCTLPYKSVWMPEDISVVNTAEADVKQRTVDLQVKHTGRVFYVPHAVFKSGCLIDVSNYPFDVQSCDIWIQSMSRGRDFLDLLTYFDRGLELETYLGSFKESQEWEVIGNYSTRVARPREYGAILMYSGRTALLFTLKLRRRVGFTALILTLPCIFLSLMTTVIFCLPPERPDRHMLAMSLFTSFTVLLLILVDNAPPSAASIPKLGIYYCFNMQVIIVSVIVSVFIIFISRRGHSGRPPPACFRKVVLGCLSRPLCLRKEAAKVMDAEDDAEDKPFSDVVEGSAANGEDKTSAGDKKEVVVSIGEKRKNPKVAEKQWKMITTVLDRLCAVCFFVVNVLALSLLFPRP